MTETQLDGLRTRYALLLHSLKYGCEQSIRQAFRAYVSYCQKIGVTPV